MEDENVSIHMKGVSRDEQLKGGEGSSPILDGGLVKVHKYVYVSMETTLRIIRVW